MTLRVQCWLFAIGAALFALGTAPGFASAFGADATNVVCFVGSWFFTSAALIQLRLSLDAFDRAGGAGSAGAVRLAARLQFIGTVLFNVSTATAVWAHRVPAERRFMWTPDALGSILFLLSSVMAVAALVLWVSGTVTLSRDWIPAWINLSGSVAFGVSAVGAFVRRTGVSADEWLANAGTFIGALCFLVAALMSLPRRDRTRQAATIGPH